MLLMNGFATLCEIAVLCTSRHLASIFLAQADKLFVLVSILGYTGQDGELTARSGIGKTLLAYRGVVDKGGRLDIVDGALARLVVG